MNYKLLVMLLLTASSLYSIILSIIDYKSKDNPIPDNVSDIYDEATYLKWKAYNSELCGLDVLSDIVTFVITIVLLGLNLHSEFVKLLCGGYEPDSIYVGLLCVLLFDIVISSTVSAVFSYIRNMKIEQKYGFNKMTGKTFAADIIKDFVIEALLTTGLLCLFALIHSALGSWTLVLFTGVMILFLLGFTFLYPKLNRVYNKFHPLEEGELRTKLSELLSKHGYSVKEIEVMDASRRSSKSNAYFSGFGKLKTIVLYDTLIESMSVDEICAVFAHELGHGLHKDTLKNSFRSFFLIFVIVVLAWLCVSTDSICQAFGFAELNYGFSFIILSSAVIPFIAPLINIVTNYFSRKAEYRADAQAVSEGYGEPLISALKKLSKENFSNLSPAKIIVSLDYSHPTTSQRIAAINELN